MDAIFNKKDLPVSDLEKLGLYRDGHLNIDKENLDALLSGRRTDMISLKDLKAEGFRIGQLDARLSLARQPDGTLNVMVHPIYKDAQKHDMLLNEEAENLKNGRLANVRKTHTDADGKSTTVVIEYDGLTREYVSYDPAKVTAPDSVNNIPLSSKQQQDFRDGKVVELNDGTKFQHNASDRRGILSNRTGLFLSILVDGGVSYFLITGVRNLIASREKQKEGYYQGYEDAMKDVGRSGEKPMGEIESGKRHYQQDEGYKRSSSR